MILADWTFVDQKKAINALVNISFFLLSVIFIGIGNNYFKEMIQIDEDDVPLVSSTEVKRTRDLVKFITFNKYGNDWLVKYLEKKGNYENIEKAINLLYDAYFIKNILKKFMMKMKL